MRTICQADLDRIIWLFKNSQVIENCGRRYSLHSESFKEATVQKIKEEGWHEIATLRDSTRTDACWLVLHMKELSLVSWEGKHVLTLPNLEQSGKQIVLEPDPIQNAAQRDTDVGMVRGTFRQAIGASIRMAGHRGAEAS